MQRCKLINILHVNISLMIQKYFYHIHSIIILHLTCTLDASLRHISSISFGKYLLEINYLIHNKHNTYSLIKSFDGITSIGQNLSKTEKYKGIILIRVSIQVTILLRIFFQVNSITQNFCFEIFFGKANNVIYLQTNCHKKNCK